MASSDFNSPSPNREQMLRMAINAVNEDNRDAARMMFRQILDDDKRNERAMMWMAKLSETRAERMDWLNRVLQVNPNNENARDALDKMAHSRSSKDNRTLLIFGVIAVVLILVGVLAAVLVITSAG